MKKALVLLLALLAASCILFGCQPATDNNTDSTTGDVTPAPGPDPATVIGSSEYDLVMADPATELVLVDRAQTNLGNFVADAYRAAAGADLAFVTAREIGADLAKGDITIADVSGVLPEEKELVSVTVTGAQLIDALELAYATLPKGSPDYMHVSGAYVVINPIKTEDRIVEFRIGENSEIDPEATYNVTYSSGVSAEIADLLKGQTLKGEAVTNREAVISFITDTFLGKVGLGYENAYGDGRVNVIPMGQTELADAASQLPQVYITTDETIGRDDYVDCVITIHDPTGVYSDIYDTESSIKVRGNSTSSGAKKPYNIKLDSKVELLGLGKGKKWCLLANMYDKTQFRNKLAYDFALELGISYTSSARLAEVYLNGEYRGMYLIAEPVDVGSTMVDIDTDNGDYLMEVEPYRGYAETYGLTCPQTGIILAFNDPDEPTEEQQKWMKVFMSNVELALLSNDYELVKQYIDVESFAQNYVIQELFKNVDYVQSSTRYYIKDGKLYEGPVWDFDLSSGNCSSKFYPAYNNTDTSGLSYEGIYAVALFNQYLFRYDEFKTLALEKYLEFQPRIVNLYEDNELGRCKIDVFYETYGEAAARNNELWSVATAFSTYEHTPVDGTYEGEILFLKNWLKNRNEYILNYYGLAE